MNNYGKELILDLHEVKNIHLFTRSHIEKFMIDLCDLIKMQREDLYFWDELYVPDEEKYTEDHLKGTSAVQFITTSNITIHTLDVMKRMYLNIFTCKDFDPEKAKEFCVKYFKGKVINFTVIDRI